MNITRVINLLRAYFIERRKMLLILTIIAFAVATLEPIGGLLEIAPLAPYGFLIVLAGMFFQPSLKRNNSTHFFSLPVTVGEKFCHAIVVFVTLMIACHIILIAGTYAGYYLIRPVFNSTQNVLVANGIGILELNIWYLRGYLFYAAVLSTFLFGSIYFKKKAFLKTLAVGLGFLLIFIPLYNYLLLFIAFGSFMPFTGGEYSFEMTHILHLSFYAKYSYMIFSVITLFFLSLTYLRLKETEV